MGTLTLTYNGTPGGVATTLTASATISDADATTIVAWGEAMIAAKQQQQSFRRGGVAQPSPPAPTPQDVFTLLVTQWISQVVSTVTSWNQQQALQKITSTATLPAPIQITPNS